LEFLEISDKNLPEIIPLMWLDTCRGELVSK